MFINSANEQSKRPTSTSTSTSSLTSTSCGTSQSLTSICVGVNNTDCQRCILVRVGRGGRGVFKRGAEGFVVDCKLFKQASANSTLNYECEETDDRRVYFSYYSVVAV